MRIGTLTGGGDAPGLDAAIRAVVRVAHPAGHRTSGVRNGWAGALEGLQVAHTADAADLLVHGTYMLRGALDRLTRTAPAPRIVDDQVGRPHRPDDAGRWSPSRTAVRPWVGRHDDA